MTRRKILLLSALLVLLNYRAHASIVITGTRVIYPADKREVTVKLTNDGTRPELMQAWIDRGNEDHAGSNNTAPFLVTPPLARIEPNQGQSLRIMYTGKNIVQDKESVFWLNVLGVPTMSNTAAGAAVNKLDIAFQTRIKVFYRPRGLAGKAEQAYQQISWKIVAAADGKSKFLEAKNDSAYHVSQVNFAVLVGEQRYAGDSGMLAPGARKQFAFKDGASFLRLPAQVVYSYINDDGAAIEVSQPVSE